MAEVITEFLSLDINDFITGIFGLIGVFIGGIITSRSTLNTERLKVLSECYAEVLTYCTDYISERTVQNNKKLFLAIHKTLLFCSKKSGKILHAIFVECAKR